MNKYSKERELLEGIEHQLENQFDSQRRIVLLSAQSNDAAGWQLVQECRRLVQIETRMRKLQRQLTLLWLRLEEAEEAASYIVGSDSDEGDDA